MHERDRNMRRLRLLRRTGGATAGAHLVGRNAELNGALLAGRAGPRAAGAVPSYVRRFSGRFRRPPTTA